jgi:hypothetical protein
MQSKVSFPIPLPHRFVIVTGPTTSGKTTLTNMFLHHPQIKSAMAAQVNGVVCVVGQNLASFDNASIYSRSNYQEIFPRAEAIHFIIDGNLNSNLLTKMQELMNLPHQSVDHLLASDKTKSDGELWMETDSGSLELLSLTDALIKKRENSMDQNSQMLGESEKVNVIILDDVDVHGGSREEKGQMMRKFLSQWAHHKNICLIWLRTSTSGPFRDFICDQAHALMIPLHGHVSYPAVSTFFNRQITQGTHRRSLAASFHNILQQARTLKAAGLYWDKSRFTDYKDESRDLPKPFIIPSKKNGKL